MRTAYTFIVGSALLASAIMVTSVHAATFQPLQNLPGSVPDGTVVEISPDGGFAVGRDYSGNGNWVLWDRHGQAEYIGDTAGVADITTYGAALTGRRVWPDLKPLIWTRSGGWSTINSDVSSWSSLRSDDSGTNHVSIQDGFHVDVAQRFTGSQGINPNNREGITGASAVDISADGSVIVGNSGPSATRAIGQPGGYWRWEKHQGVTHLGAPSDVARIDVPIRIASDGKSFVTYGRGDSYTDSAFRWHIVSGFESLGTLSGGNSRPNGISGNGSIVVGVSDGEAFIWDEVQGMQSLTQALIDQGTDLTGWQLTSAVDISSDGGVIVGNGINPDGDRQAWMATLDGFGSPGASNAKPGNRTIDSFDSGDVGMFDNDSSVELGLLPEVIGGTRHSQIGTDGSGNVKINQPDAPEQLVVTSETGTTEVAMSYGSMAESGPPLNQDWSEAEKILIDVSQATQAEVRVVIESDGSGFTDEVTLSLHPGINEIPLSLFAAPNLQIALIPIIVPTQKTLYLPQQGTQVDMGNIDGIAFYFNVEEVEGVAGSLIVDGIYLDAVPEPASLAILGLGCLGMLRRRDVYLSPPSPWTPARMESS